MIGLASRRNTCDETATVKRPAKAQIAHSLIENEQKITSKDADSAYLAFLEERAMAERWRRGDSCRVTLLDGSMGTSSSSGLVCGRSSPAFNEGRRSAGGRSREQAVDAGRCYSAPSDSARGRETLLIPNGDIICASASAIQAVN